MSGLGRDAGRTHNLFIVNNLSSGLGHQQQIDILLSLKGRESSRLLLVLRDGFGGFLPQRPYFK